MPHAHQREPLYRQVIEMLRSRIESGELADGERLPSIADLSVEFGVSHITIRSAIKALAALGLVEARPRSGVFACAPRQQPLSLSGERVIGVIVPESSSVFTSAIIRAIEGECRRRNYHVLIANTNKRLDIEARLLRELSQQVAGLLITPIIGGDYAAYQSLLERDVPFVFVDQHIPSLPVSAVTTDNVRGGYLATRHLLEVGRRKIFFLGEPNATSVEERLRGYRKALNEAGIGFEEALTRFSSFRVVVDGYTMTRHLLAEEWTGEPLGIFATNDFFARSSCVAIREAGLRVPQDIAVVGYDDMISVFSDPPLSSVRQHFQAMGRAATRLLLDGLRGTTSRSTRQIRLRPELIVRNSSDENSGFSLARHIESDTAESAMDAAHGILQSEVRLF